MADPSYENHFGGTEGGCYLRSPIQKGQEVNLGLLPAQDVEMLGDDLERDEEGVLGGKGKRKTEKEMYNPQKRRRRRSRRDLWLG
jgi:hypothetical protein